MDSQQLRYARLGIDYERVTCRSPAKVVQRSRVLAAALFVLATAAAGAGFVPAGMPRSIGKIFLTPRPGHHICRGAFLAQFAGHEAHVRVDVAEESPIRGAQVV